MIGGWWNDEDPAYVVRLYNENGWKPGLAWLLLAVALRPSFADDEERAALEEIREGVFGGRMPVQIGAKVGDDLFWRCLDKDSLRAGRFS